MDIEAVRQGLATNAKTIAGLNGYGYVPDSISEPAFYPQEVDIDFTGAFNRGLDELMITCLILVGRADDKASQKRLNAYLSGSGASSLKAALESDSTLGGACDDLMVMRVQGYRYYEHAGNKYIGAELVVKVIGSGS